MIIYLLFNRLLPPIIFLSISLLLCKGMYHNQQKENVNDLIQINKFEKNIEKMLEPSIDFEDNIEEQINVIKNLEKNFIKEKILNFEKYFKEFIKMQNHPIFHLSEMNKLKFKTNPFDDNPIEIGKLEKIITQNFSDKLPKESEKYKILFENINSFWSEKAEKEEFIDSLDNTSHNPSSNIQGSSSSNIGSLDLIIFTENKNYPPLSNMTIYKHFIKLRKTLNKFLRQLKIELVVGFKFNVYKNIGKDLEMLDNLFDQKISKNMCENSISKIDKFLKGEIYSELHLLFTKADDHYKKLDNAEIFNYWYIHIGELSSPTNNLNKVISQSKSTEIHDLEEFINNGYGGFGEDLKPSRLFKQEKLKKIEQDENSDIKLSINILEEMLPKKINYSDEIEMKNTINYLLKFYSEIEQIPSYTFNYVYDNYNSKNEDFNLWKTHNNLLKASQEVYNSLNTIIDTFNSFEDLNGATHRKKDQAKEILKELLLKGKINHNQEEIFEPLKQRLISWSLAEFWLKDAFKKIAENEHLSFSHLSSLVENIEKDLELPSNWLNLEFENFKDANARNIHNYSNEMNTMHLAVLIRINAAKVLLAYTRMKKIFGILNSINLEEYKNKAHEMAIIYSSNFRGQPKNYAKHIFEFLKNMSS